MSEDYFFLPHPVVQSGKNFAHKLIFSCVTMAALWSHAFPTFSFLGHSNVPACVYIFLTALCHRYSLSPDIFLYDNSYMMSFLSCE